VALLAATRLAFALEPAEDPGPAVDPPGRVARLSLIQGDVSMAPAGQQDWVEAVQNRPLTNGDKLWIESNGRAELEVGSATVHLDHDTGFGFIKLEDDVMQTSLTDGAATIHVERLGEHETVQVETPNASVVIRHPGEYYFEVDAGGDRTVVKVRSGEADVVGGAKSESYKVRADEEGTFSGVDDLKAQMDPIAPRTEFEAWAHERDARDQRSVSSQYVSDDVIGYEDLDDNGEWTHDSSYGYVWHPSYVASDWAPYRYGRWAYIGPWGWTWVDDAPWGFAPFHYGRWAYLNTRWCWVPGPRHLRPVYAPALVGWTGGSGTSVSIAFGHGVGWFPLAPHEVYVPAYGYTPRYIRRVNVANTTIINNTYITNVYARNPQPWNYRHAWRTDAVTVVSRDYFVGGHPLGERRVRVSDRDLRAWRDDPRPPATIRPEPSSVLAGRSIPGRTRFENDGPKSRGDYFRGDQRFYGRPQEDVKRASQPVPRSDALNDAARSGSVNGMSPSPRTREPVRDHDRVEVMRAEETRTPGNARRVETQQPPVQSFRDTPREVAPRRTTEPGVSRYDMSQPRESRESRNENRFEGGQSTAPRQQPHYVAPPAQSQPRNVAPQSQPRVVDHPAPARAQPAPSSSPHPASTQSAKQPSSRPQGQDLRTQKD